MAPSIDVFLPYILPSAIACPDFSARSAIIEAAIDFCTNSSAWTETLDLIYISGGTHSYELDVPKDSRAVLIKNVWAEDRELVAKPMSEIACRLPNWQTAQGDSMYFNQQNWEELRVYPTPNNPAAATLTVRASLAPTRSAKTLPQFLVDRHFQTIVSGALARLLVVPSQQWSNPQLSAYYKAEFSQACGIAKAEIFHDRVPGSMRVAPRRFGG